MNNNTLTLNDAAGRRAFLVSSIAVFGAATVVNAEESTDSQKKETAQSPTPLDTETDEVDDDLIEAVRRAVQTPSSDGEAFLEDLGELAPLINASRSFPVYVAVSEEATVQRCMRLKLGESPLPNQTRLHKHGTYDYRFETRSQKWIVYCDICHPRINEARVREILTRCARNATVVAVITAVVTENPAAGYAIFWPTFLQCLRTAASELIAEVSVDLGKRTETGCWSNHC